MSTDGPRLETLPVIAGGTAAPPSQLEGEHWTELLPNVHLLCTIYLSGPAAGRACGVRKRGRAASGSGSGKKLPGSARRVQAVDYGQCHPSNPPNGRECHECQNFAATADRKLLFHAAEVHGAGHRD